MLLLKYLWNIYGILQNTNLPKFSGTLDMKFGRPLGHFWFGYIFILCVLCICLVEFLLDNTYETKLQAFTKKYSVTI